MYWYNCCISCFLGSKWTKLKSKYKQIDAGQTTWAVDVSNKIHALYKGKWKSVPGRLNHISSGKSGVWGVMGSSIWYRVGVTGKQPLGTTWKKIAGGLKQIDSGPKGIVCGVNSVDNIFCRLQISPKAPFGKRWIRIPGKLKYISCGGLGHWGVNKKNQVFFRLGVTRNRPQGLNWKRVSGSLVQVEAGKFGEVIGINAKGQMLARTGVTEQRPVGRSWKKVPGVRLFKHASVGPGVVFGIDSFMNIYRGTLPAIAGEYLLQLLVVYVPLSVNGD